MQKLFEFVEHIGKFRVLVQTRDIANKAVTTDKIGDGEVKSRNIGEGEMKSANIGDGEVKTPNIEDGAVTPEKIAKGAVTPDKVSDDFLEMYIKPVLDGYEKKYKDALDDMQNQIDALDEHGVAVSNQFGNNPHIAVSQKTVTNAINKLWDKIGDITGEWIGGIRIMAVPGYFTGNECLVHITASSIENEGVFEEIEFYGNGELISKAEPDTYLYETDAVITAAADIMCRAKVLGKWHEKTVHVAKYERYWVGAGAGYADVMIKDNLKSVTPHTRIACDVVVANAGDKFFVIVEESCKESIIRADMNGFEIPMTSRVETVDGTVFRVFESVNGYEAGTYNIDING